MSIDITGRKAAVLAALYNASKPLGLGHLHAKGEPMDEGTAAILIARAGSARFDYLWGRVMKVDLSGDSFDPRLYDRDNGEGAAARAVEGVVGAESSPPVGCDTCGAHLGEIEAAQALADLDAGKINGAHCTLCLGTMKVEG